MRGLFQLSNVPAIIKCFRKEHGEERDTKRRAKMKGTASKLQDFSRLQKKCIIADALEVIQPLKRQFQPDIMEFDRIEDILEDTYDDLDRLKTTQGTNEQRLMTQTIEIRKCESKEEEKRIEKQWNDSAIMIRTRGQNAKSDKNVFLAAEGMDIPIYKHSKESLAKNKKFKMNLLNGTKQALKDRYDNVGQFSFLSVFHPKCIDKFLDEHPMPNKIKNSRKNAIVDWFIDCGFAKDDIKKSVDHWLSYYSKLDGASGHEIMYKYKHIEDTQLRNYIWILYTNKIKSKKIVLGEKVW
eukprot:803300_1